MFAPSESSVAGVRNWLIESGIASHRIVHSDNKGWLAFDATAEEMEGILNAEYHLYDHTSKDEMAAGCES